MNLAEHADDIMMRQFFLPPTYPVCSLSTKDRARYEQSCVRDSFWELSIDYRARVINVARHMETQGAEGKYTAPIRQVRTAGPVRYRFQHPDTCTRESNMGNLGH